jgi:hypothetical protein
MMKECAKYELNGCYTGLSSKWLEMIDKEIRRTKHGDNSLMMDGNSAAELDEEKESQRSSIDFSQENDLSGDQLGILDESYFEGDDKEITLSQSDVIHDWLFSEEVPFFNKNDYIKGMLSINDELETLYRFILSPFKCRLHTKARQKYKKFVQNLGPEFKQTWPNNIGSFFYDPTKHNGYYLRARRVMITLLFKPNITTLSQANTEFVDVFYKCLQEEVWDNPRSKANMDWVCKIIQYFLMIDIAGSLKNMIKYHIPFYLLGNIEVFSTRII